MLTFTRECLALIVDTSLSGGRVARELDRLIEVRGPPSSIVSDNGTELTSRAMLRWQLKRAAGTRHSGAFVQLTCKEGD